MCTSRSKLKGIENINEQPFDLTVDVVPRVHIGIPMNALLRFVQDEYPEANNDELAQLARAIFDDTPAYLKEIDHLLNPKQTTNE